MLKRIRCAHEIQEPRCRGRGGGALDTPDSLLLRDFRGQIRGCLRVPRSRQRGRGGCVSSSSRCLANRRSRCTPSCLAISTGPLPSFPLPSFASLTPCSQIAQLQRCEPISEEEVKQLCLKAREILIEEGNVQVVDSPVTVRRVILPVIHRGSTPVRYVAISTGNFGI